MHARDPDRPPDSKPLPGRARPMKARVNAGAARLQLSLRKIDSSLRTNPASAKAFDGVTATWNKLVAAFCETIDPYFARFIGDLRLVGVVTAAGDIDLHKIGKDGGVALGSLASLDLETGVALRQTKWSAIELRLQREQVLQRTLSLPSASRDFLGPIIEHRLERLTPWRADKVLYGYRIVDGAPETAGTVPVALLAASKDVVEGFVRQLSEAGFPPTRIGAAQDSIDLPMSIDLRRPGTEPTRVDTRKLVSRVFLLVIGSLVVVYGATAFVASGAVGDLEATSAKLMKARLLLKGKTSQNTGSREKQLLAAKDPDRATVVLIDKLATAIPDDTYLKELVVTQDKVRLVGTSTNAPALVGKLEAAGLANVRFNAAVTREKDLRDSFEITADRSPAAPDERGTR